MGPAMKYAVSRMVTPARGAPPPAPSAVGVGIAGVGAAARAGMGRRAPGWGRAGAGAPMVVGVVTRTAEVMVDDQVRTVYLGGQS